MSMAGRVAARAVFDKHALDALAGDIEVRAGRRGSPWRSSPSAHPRVRPEWQRGDEQRERMRFIESSFGL